MVCLSRPRCFIFFKGCLPQILLGSFMNISTQTSLDRKNTVSLLLQFHFLILGNIYIYIYKEINTIHWPYLCMVPLVIHKTLAYICHTFLHLQQLSTHICQGKNTAGSVTQIHYSYMLYNPRCLSHSSWPRIKKLIHKYMQHEWVLVTGYWTHLHINIVPSDHLFSTYVKGSKKVTFLKTLYGY